MPVYGWVGKLIFQERTVAHDSGKVKRVTSTEILEHQRINFNYYVRRVRGFVRPMQSKVIPFDKISMVYPIISCKKNVFVPIKIGTKSYNVQVVDPTKAEEVFRALTEINFINKYRENNK